jgi:phenylpyruvate tautomerase PptA (4-oxalocrotonate tautomerase family)
MPLVLIDLRRGKPAAYRRAICDGINRALRETFNVPENDRFVVVNEHNADNFVHAESYLGIPCSDDLIIVQTRSAIRARRRQSRRCSPASAPCLRKIPAYVRKTCSSISLNAKSKTGRSVTALPST